MASEIVLKYEETRKPPASKCFIFKDQKIDVSVVLTIEDYEKTFEKAIQAAFQKTMKKAIDTQFKTISSTFAAMDGVIERTAKKIDTLKTAKPPKDAPAGKALAERIADITKEQLENRGFADVLRADLEACHAAVCEDKFVRIQAVEAVKLAGIKTINDKNLRVKAGAAATMTCTLGATAVATAAFALTAPVSLPLLALGAIATGLSGLQSLKAVYDKFKTNLDIEKKISTNLAADFKKLSSIYDDNNLEPIFKHLAELKTVILNNKTHIAAMSSKIAEGDAQIKKWDAFDADWKKAAQTAGTNPGRMLFGVEVTNSAKSMDGVRKSNSELGVKVEKLEKRNAEYEKLVKEAEDFLKSIQKENLYKKIQSMQEKFSDKIKDIDPLDVGNQVLGMVTSAMQAAGMV